MAPDNPVSKLATLSSREFEMVRLRCNGLEYSRIAELLYVAEPTVKTTMGRAMVKLGLDKLNQTERLIALIETYCPVLKDDPRFTTSVSREEPEDTIAPYSEEVNSMSEEDQPRAQSNESGPRVVSSSRTGRPRRPSGATIQPGRLFLGIIVVILALGVGSVLLVKLLSSSQEPLFTDDFDSGLRPEWRSEIGAWREVNGEYTLTEINGWTMGLSTVGQLGWENYRVRTDLHLRDAYQSQDVSVLVRVQDTRNYLELRFQDRADPRAAWYIVQNNVATEVSNTRSFDYPLDKAFTVEIEARAGTLTALVNGQQISRWTDAPFLTGKVGVKMNSRLVAGTASIDNFVVEILSPE
jgi:DNA-binding CsgD family transcriptional regulator